ncbi:glyoxylate carboligase [Stackebrandtia nassauensis]|uniref:Thiamine pyrophosphate protein TPP binding domain protein n=1 Tax=Stackebrandtia nassauensis (strain DSM 44728 / CIP 108903 / NRRL B-16338 / NBRC 102104 / LLR-40K-21) TaxID=446470 RepID=D3Q654_STANL|nr:glyoxylate carboligase [Stackebrandtia nassauensis]ADD42229.1 thiamine pyrophosphate protein TPP binding domain protein [Stackebrandtia nassauensis DSM 44728]
MAKMPVMQAVVEVLKSEGVDIAFGCPGAAILPLYHAMEQKGGIKHLIVRHEEGATHMADGWARTNGKVGVAIGTSGPAGTNMITGLYTAIADSIPMVCITGQAPLAKLHQEAFQAVDIVDIAAPVTKWAVQVKEAAQAPWIFRQAFRIARSGRPGPVLIDLPLDVQQQLIEWDPAIDSPLPVTSVEPHLPRVEKALELLLAAEKPLILAGGGVITADASDELLAVAELLDIPVQVTLMGKGALPDDHRLNAGMTGVQTTQRYANQSFLESDVVLAVGARFGDRHTGALDVYRGERKFIHVDIEPTQLGKVFGPDLGIVSDAKIFLRTLRDLARARDTVPKRPDWTARITELKGTLERRLDYDAVPIKPPRVFAEINAAFGPDTYFVTAIGLYQIWSGMYQKVHKPRHYQVCGQAGPLGWEIPAAIGVKKALESAGQSDTEVVGVVGDYSFQFLVEELAVAAQYNVGFVLVMLNNEYLGLIRQAELEYEMNYEVDIHYDEYGADNVAIMEAYGCAGRRVFEPGDIAEAITWARKEAAATSRPVLVEVMVEREANSARGKAIDAIIEPEPIG